MKTKLNAIRKCSPCESGWRTLLKYLGKTEADDGPLSIITIIDSNGINDAVYCLRAVIGHDREIRLCAVWCARRVQYLMRDPRSIAALDVSERYANGLATEEELARARADAAHAAYAAAHAAAYAAARADAAHAAYAAANAAHAAHAAAYAAVYADAAAYAAKERAAQATELRRVCECIDAGIDPYPINREQ